VQTLYRTDRLESLGEALAVLQFARAQVGIMLKPAGMLESWLPSCSLLAR